MQTRLYAAPGTEVECDVDRSDASGDGDVSCSFSGYLVPVK